MSAAEGLAPASRHPGRRRTLPLTISNPARTGVHVGGAAQALQHAPAALHVATAGPDEAHTQVASGWDAAADRQLGEDGLTLGRQHSHAARKHCLMYPSPLNQGVG